MNPTNPSTLFDLYQLPVSFHPDSGMVKKKFYELSRLHHPDKFAQSGGEALAEALQMASMNNAAYKTLTDSDATMAYILRTAGVLENEEKYNLPPDFLMDMMDLNEAVSDYEMEPGNEAAKQSVTRQIQQHLDNWQQETAPLTQKFDAGDHSKELLLKIKDMYFRKKYLLRIRERINTFAAR